jgi:prepilin-type N-terminal cleavage/methylation domain-containing protein
MNRNRKKLNTSGYTLLELVIVIVILGVLASIVVPRYNILLLRAHQAKAKSSLGTLRTTISLYYSDTEGHYPLESYPTGTSHYTTDGLSLSAVLVPRWMDYVPIPILKDQQNTFNGITGDWDVQVRMLMTKNPIDDVYILPGPADYTPLLVSPYAFDNQKGVVYIPNGNYDLGGHYFYDW